MDPKRDNILKGKITSLLLSFSAPAVIGMIVGALYNIADTIFVGKSSGALAIAALSIVFPIQLIMMSVGTMIGVGGASVISRALGKNNPKRAANAFGSGLILNLLFSAIFVFFSFIFMDKLLVFFGASAQVMEYARQYMGIILIGLFFFSFSITGNNFLRAEGNPRASMYVMIMGAAANIVLDPLFIFGFGMGVRGAAIATVISQGLSCLYILFYYIRGKNLIKIKLSCFKFRLPLMKEIMGVGFPSFIRSSMSSVIILVFNRALGYYGNDLYIAIMGIGFRMLSLIQMPIIGINQGFSTIASFNYGAQLHNRVRRVLAVSAIWVTAIGVAGSLVIMLFTRQILGFFSSSPLLINMGIEPLRIIMMFLPFLGVQILGGGLFQAIGKPAPALIITMLKQIIFLVPAIILLPMVLGLKGVWFSIPVADFLSVIVTVVWIYKEMGSFGRKINYERVKT
ncbi:MAG: MATE family efflux transporter [Actinomycetota bacterium]|jgi:putative MATE family efflux protein|nr:MATE family efflux transporter [Actinomycetota bacterium]